MAANQESSESSDSIGDFSRLATEINQLNLNGKRCNCVEENGKFFAG